MKKIISTFLALIMILSVLTVPIFAEAAHFENITENIGTTDQKEITTQTLSDILPLPAIVSREEAIQEGYTDRVKEEEKNLYSFVFNKGNGESVMKIYSHPVKYIDSFGKVKDIGLDVRAFSDGSFRSASHEIITTFRKNISDGISLEYKDINLKMIPDIKSISASKAVSSSNNTVVSYALDEKTSYEYQLTYCGFKEDIIVNEYTGQTEYDFTIYTNGLTLVKENDSYYLKDSADTVKATIGDIIIFTADERNNTFGSMTYETVKENQEYKITIHVDKEYLRDEKTLYPIRIDPTIEVKYAISGAGAIEDITLNSLNGSSATSTALTVGLRSSYGIGRILLRAPGLNFENIPNAESITSASISLRDLMCESAPMQISCHRFTGREWTESGTNWSNANPNSYESTPLDTKTLSYSLGTSIGHRYSFDITSAVRLWYGSTSAKNMGLIFKAPDSLENGSTYQCKTLGSYNNSTYRPVITVNYWYDAEISIPATENVAEGASVTIPATVTPSNLPITWTSSDTSIATVDSNGTVTGIKAGEAVITATVYDSDGDSVPVSCTVYVHVPNGVYYIRNLNSELIIKVYNGATQNTPPIKQYNVTSSTSDFTNICQEWKLYHIGQGRYSIRPVHKLDMSLAVYNSEVVTYDTADIEFPNMMNSFIHWIIEWTSDGYVIKSAETPTLCLQIENASTEIGATVSVGSDSGTQNCRWGLEAVLTPRSGVLFYDTENDIVCYDPTKYVAPEEVIFLDDLGIEPTYYSHDEINQDFVWSSSDTSIATVNSSGSITGVSYGTVTITATHVLSSRSASYTLQVTGIPNGTYFIRNKQTGYYADIQGPTMANGTTIHQWNFNGNNSQKWIFEHQGDGFYTVKSANSTADYYLGVLNDDSTVNTDIVLRNGEVTFGMLWNVSVTSSGAFKLTAKKGYALDYALATTTTSQTNGAKLVHGQYMPNNNSYCDEWYIRPVVYALSVGGEFHDGEDVIDAADNWKLCGYSSYYNINPIVGTLDYDGLNSEVVYFSSHGSQHRIKLLNGVYLSDGSTTVTSSTVEIDNFSLPKAKLYIYDACLTACNDDGTGRNLCTETISSGVDCVIGWKKTIGSDDARKWQKHFQSKLVAGESVKAAADYANTFSYEDNTTIKCWRIYGNQSLTINQNSTVNQMVTASSAIRNNSNNGSLKSTSIKYGAHNINTLQAILKKEYASFSTGAANITTTYTNSEKTDYVIDYYYLYGDFVTNSGYSIIVNNDNIVYIRDNTIDVRNSEILNASTIVPEITDEIVATAHTQAQEEVANMGHNYAIVEQRADKYYDVISNKYYYRIMTVYETPDGMYGAIFTMYEL